MTLTDYFQWQKTGSDRDIPRRVSFYGSYPSVFADAVTQPGVCRRDDVVNTNAEDVSGAREILEKTPL